MFTDQFHTGRRLDLISFRISQFQHIELVSVFRYLLTPGLVFFIPDHLCRRFQGSIQLRAFCGFQGQACCFIDMGFRRIIDPYGTALCFSRQGAGVPGLFRFCCGFSFNYVILISIIRLFDCFFSLILFPLSIGFNCFNRFFLNSCSFIPGFSVRQPFSLLRFGFFLRLYRSILSGFAFRRNTAFFWVLFCIRKSKRFNLSFFRLGCSKFVNRCSDRIGVDDIIVCVCSNTGGVKKPHESKEER